MATCPTSPVFSNDGSIATPTEPYKPCNDLSLFRKLMVRGLEVHDEREALRTTKTVTILWLSPDHTTLHYGPSKDDVHAAKAISLNDITLVDSDPRSTRLAVHWSLSELHDRKSIIFDVDTQTSRDIMVRMLRSTIGVHQNDGVTATSPIWGGGLKSHFDPNPAPKPYTTAIVECI
jgi:hypothetical protein